jgi:hypothetical protein
MGTSAADSIGGNHAALQFFGGGNAQWITGMFGGGLKMTNEDAYALTNAPIGESAADQFSVSFWSRLDSKPNSNDSELVTPQGDNWITINPTGNTNGGNKRGVGINKVRDARDPLIGVWENYVVTYDRPTDVVTVYRDGVIGDSGIVDLPALNTRWVFGHNQGLDNTNGSYHGSLDEIQIYNRVLSASEAATLASRPPQPGTAAHLVAPAQSFGFRPVGQFATASKSLFIDPSQIDWIAWNRFPERRAVSDLYPGELFLGTYQTEVDDHFNLTITNPSGQSLTIAMDQNDGSGNPLGLQSMIRGAPALAPNVIRGNNLQSPTIFDEAGGFNSIFTVPGEYTFSFTFQNIGGDASYPDVYLLLHTAPPLPGDYNNNHVVDAADYTTWRNNLGAPDESPLHNNGDGMNGVDFGDFTFWKQRYGDSNIPAAGAALELHAVPEPSSTLLLLGVISVCIAMRYRGNVK